MDMGLGKTRSVLDALEDRHLPVLVVAPKKVAENTWPEEVAAWQPGLSVSVASGGPDARLAALRAMADVTVLSIDNVGDLDKLTGRGAWPWRTLVIDELSKFKGAGARYDMLGKHRFGRPRLNTVWGLTGTPAPNGYLGLWAQMMLLDRGQRLGTPMSAFRSRYFYGDVHSMTRDGVVTNWIPFDETHDHIKHLLSDMCLSFSGAEYLDLPEVVHNQNEVTLPPIAMKAYRHLARELAVDLADIFGEGARHTAANAGILTQKLTQCSAGFIYPDDRDIRPDEPASQIHASKLDRLDDVIDQVGEPMLVFYGYHEELSAIRKRHPTAVHIDEPNAIKRWNNGEIQTLLAHPAGAGHGLNLQHGGHHMAFTTLPWDLELRLQAIGRFQRQGQKNSVVVHDLIADKTIDQRIFRRLAEKDTTQEDLLSHFASLI